VGTAKSRVFRARRQLQSWLMGEERAGTRVAEPARDRQEAKAARHDRAAAIA
jgi:RNA polymerase sigma-70 factor (ECF subfamily)